VSFKEGSTVYLAKDKLYSQNSSYFLAYQLRGRNMLGQF